MHKPRCSPPKHHVAVAVARVWWLCGRCEWVLAGKTEPVAPYIYGQTYARPVRSLAQFCVLENQTPVVGWVYARRFIVLTEDECVRVRFTLYSRTRGYNESCLNVLCISTAPRQCELACVARRGVGCRPHRVDFNHPPTHMSVHSIRTLSLSVFLVARYVCIARVHSHFRNKHFQPHPVDDNLHFTIWQWDSVRCFCLVVMVVEEEAHTENWWLYVRHMTGELIDKESGWAHLRARCLRSPFRSVDLDNFRGIRMLLNCLNVVQTIK